MFNRTSLRTILAISAFLFASAGNLAQAVMIDSASVVFDESNGLMSLAISVSSVNSPPTTMGLDTISFDFDGDNEPFVSTAMVAASSVPLSASFFEDDYANLTFASPVTMDAMMSFVFSGLDFSTLLTGPNNDIDILFNEQSGSPGMGGGCGGSEPNCIQFFNVVEAQSGVVPIPGAAWLLGLGLFMIGLRQAGFRRSKLD